MKRIALLLVFVCLLGASGGNGVRFSGVRLSTASVGGGGDWASTFGACTSGTNCLCDQLASDSSIYWSECYDHAAMVEVTSTDGGTYGNGNAVADSGGVGDRGLGSHWVAKYHQGDGGGQWAYNTPTSPTNGPVCTAPGPGGRCAGVRTYTQDDRWSLGAVLPYMAILKNGWFSGLVSGTSDPAIPGSGGATVFGDAAFGFPTQPGAVGPVIGNRDWSVRAQLGYTAAWAYSSNLLTMNPSLVKLANNVAWKHNEFSGAGAGSWGTPSGYQEALLGMHINHEFAFPYSIVPGISILNCGTRKAAATITKGLIFCPSEAVPGTTRVTMTLRPDPNDYTFDGSTVGSGPPTYSWDLTKWHCHMIHYDWTTITATRIRAWFDGHLLIDVTVDLSQERYDAPSGTDGVTGFYYNHYANLNGDGNPDTNEPAAHYMDNEFFRDGTPRQCDDIGFSSIADVTF